MVRCQCCDRAVDSVMPVPATGQLVCARCYRLISGMLGVFDVLRAGAAKQKKPCDA